MTHSRQIPDQQQTQMELTPLIDALYEILPEAAAERVLPYFGIAGYSVNDELASHMLRHEIVHRLALKGVDVRCDDETEDEQESTELELKPLSYSGIEGTYKGWRFKLLRSRNGAVPPPGKSRRRALFYSQDEQLPLPGFEDRIMSIAERHRPNVTLLWNADSEYGYFFIRVAIPKRPTSAYGTVECYFNVPVPRRGGPSTTRGDINGLTETPQEPDMTRKATGSLERNIEIMESTGELDPIDTLE